MKMNDFESIRVGESIPPLKFKYSPEKNKAYCRLEHEINPLHFDPNYARKLGYKDVVIAGIFTASFFPKMITDWLGPEIFIERMKVKFMDPAYINDVVLHEGVVSDKLVENGEKLAEAELIVRFK